MQTLPNTGTVQAKATITPELSLFSKFRGVTAPEFGRGAKVGGYPERCQEIENNFHIKTSSNSLHTRIDTSAARGQATSQALGAWLGQLPTH
ncbi:hypothetical protein Acr_17g0002360 [Actinidia rufa]|uniref:Uncharacterized protein n=1 Tax=Actinidia rufa TaxID=165716 RepID=A0A7J0G1K4_9ERIC|nr:hypothetical protein Acr_17g0002360 [Actinidia rufa]